ncbi:27696_t:CDS:2, partial [Dentiscutata erythropus]
DEIKEIKQSFVNTTPTGMANSNISEQENDDRCSRVAGGNRSHKKKGMDELKHKLFNSPLESDSPSSINHNNATEIFGTGRLGKVIYDNIDEASQHLAQLCDKAIDAEDRANRANQEEILYWCLYWKDFRNQLDEIIRSGGGKIGEKKAQSILYDTITEQLSILRKKRSQELGLQLQD